MSGGRFQYKQFDIMCIREQLEQEVDDFKGMLAGLDPEDGDLYDKALAKIEYRRLMDDLKNVSSRLDALDLFMSGDTSLRTYIEKSYADRAKKRKG
jgi:hypothetical protein